MFCQASEDDLAGLAAEFDAFAHFLDQRPSCTRSPCITLVKALPVKLLPTNIH
jgi:hypothetical protein